MSEFSIHCSLLKYNCVLTVVVILMIGIIKPICMGFEVDTVINNTIIRHNVTLRECLGVDVRNDINNFNRWLRGCTVVKGNLLITLMNLVPKGNFSISDYSFPELRFVLI